MSEWIKCDSRLPFTPSSLQESSALGHRFYNSKPVLCFVKSAFGGSYMRVGTYCGYSGRWTDFDEGEYRGTSCVTHWMLLPEPPVESGE